MPKHFKDPRKKRASSGQKLNTASLTPQKKTSALNQLSPPRNLTSLRELVINAMDQSLRTRKAQENHVYTVFTHLLGRPTGICLVVGHTQDSLYISRVQYSVIPSLVQQLCQPLQNITKQWSDTTVAFQMKIFPSWFLFCQLSSKGI